MAELAGSFNYIINTVSAQHDYNEYMNLLTTDGTMVLLGAPPPELTPISAFPFIL